MNKTSRDGKKYAPWHHRLFLWLDASHHLDGGQHVLSLGHLSALPSAPHCAGQMCRVRHGLTGDRRRQLACSNATATGTATGRDCSCRCWRWRIGVRRTTTRRLWGGGYPGPVTRRGVRDATQSHPQSIVRDVLLFACGVCEFGAHTHIHVHLHSYTDTQTHNDAHIGTGAAKSITN